VRACEVITTSERAETDPKVFTKIHLLFRIRGRQLKANLVERAIHLSHSKYCSATKMLGMTAEITHGYELIED
jgi:putative redox protein